MDKLQASNEALNDEEREAEYIPEGDSLVEQLLRSMILAYQQAFNKHNTVDEAEFTLTITIHKVATPDGNKDCGYLRLDKHTRPKDFKPTPEDEGWYTRLVHQEVYFFKSMQERLNPHSKWKEQLYINCLTRLTSAGLEYGELLQRLKNVEEGKKIAGIESEEEAKLNKLGLVGAKEMPKPLSQEDEKYKDWLSKERAKEGL